MFFFVSLIRRSVVWTMMKSRPFYAIEIWGPYSYVLVPGISYGRKNYWIILLSFLVKLSSPELCWSNLSSFDIWACFWQSFYWSWYPLFDDKFCSKILFEVVNFWLCFESRLCVSNLLLYPLVILRGYILLNLSCIHLCW